MDAFNDEQAGENDESRYDSRPSLGYVLFAVAVAALGVMGFYAVLSVFLDF